MKKITTIELVTLNGGSGTRDCIWLLQYEAGTHVSSGNEDMEDDYWEDWAVRYEKCAGVTPN